MNVYQTGHGSHPEFGSFSLTVGGVRCTVYSQEHHFLDSLRSRYHWFISHGAADYQILVKLGRSEEVCSGIKPFHPLIKRVSASSNYIIKRADRPFEAVANTYSRKVMVKMLNSDKCFDSFLQMLFILIIAEERSLLLKASAVGQNGKGAVYFGQHEGGAAAAPLSAGNTLDDANMVIVRPHHTGYRIYGTPFGVSQPVSRNNLRMELEAFYSLAEARNGSSETMEKKHALAGLYQCVPFFEGDSRLQEKILDACRKLVNDIPVYEAGSLPETDFDQDFHRHVLSSIAKPVPGINGRIYPL